MKMKKLLTYTSTLLRTALLVGALAFVNVSQTQAQYTTTYSGNPVHLTTDMPDAFETKIPVIGDGEYYFIQFYEEITYSPFLFQSFLGEVGENAVMHAMDYLPFASNRQWTLEAVTGSTTKFKLKSKRGFYAKRRDDGFFISTSDPSQATEFERIERGGYRAGFCELRVSNGVCLGRRYGNTYNSEWQDMVSVGNDNIHGKVRFAKLKANAAHIIYYREEHADNLSNSQFRAQETTTRHYLTYSDADAAITTSVIFNGSLEANLGGGDASCFYIGDPTSTTPRQATITNGIGVDNSKGISVTSSASDDPQEWDTQFFIRAKDVIPAGKTIHVEFDYKASAAVNGVHTQAHAEPGVYRGYGTFGTLDFTTGWQHYSRDVEIPEAMGNDFRTIALDLYKNNAGVIYYFDNIVFTAPTTPKVSSRRSIIPSDKSIWTLPTAAAYHQDGLWVLEEASNNGQFYIKKYGDEQYLTVRQVTDYNYCTVLGDKDDLYGKFDLETPTANRYTRIHNVCPLWGLGRYLSYSDGDGSSVMQGPYYDNSWWYAGFYPVEVPVSQKDEFFQVRLVLKVNAAPESKQTILIGDGWSNPGMARELLPGVSTNYGIVGAKYTPSDDYKNCFKIENLQVPSGYDKIIVRFASPVKGDWQINGVVNGNNGSGPNGGSFESITGSSRYFETENGVYYEMDLRLNNSVVQTVRELSIFNGGGRQPLTIAEVYFYNGTMINNGTGAAMGSSEGNPSLWELEQVDNYKAFRLKNPDTGRYLAGNGEMTEPNDPNGETYTIINGETVYNRKAETNANWKFWEHFSLKWYIPVETDIKKEIVVNGYVRHRESYLKAYADDQVIEDQEGLRKQGLARDVDSDWKETINKNTKKPYLLDGFIQKTNYFEITHYIKKGSSKVIEFPTVLNRNNDHIFFQRFYNYDEDDIKENGEPNMDLDNLKAHVSLDTRDDGDVQYFLYLNGMVTGQKLKWENADGTDIPDGGMARNEQRRFNFTNSDGKTFNVGVDVARYSDLKYEEETVEKVVVEDGQETTEEVTYYNLREPSLTMRYLFYMNDAKEMAMNLTACPEGGSKWLEKKDFHFGRTQVPYTKFKKVGYRGEFIPVRHVFSDYWVYDDPNLITKDANGKLVVNTSYISNNFNIDTTNEDALNDFLDQHLVSAVNDNSSGKIEVEVIPGNTGIRRGGYNAYLESTITNGLNNETYDDSNDDENNYQGFYFYDKLSPSPKTEYGNSRFVVFRYPASGIIPDNCYGLNNPAYIRVYLNAGNNKRYQLAEYTLYFDANMATRPWTKVKNGTHYANGVDCVKGTSRDPNNLRARAGLPIAKVTFDFPEKMKIGNSKVEATYHYPSKFNSTSNEPITKHNGGDNNAGGTITYTDPNTGKTEYSSPVPLTFDHTNYAFDGDGCNWGSYAIVTGKRTTWGNDRIVEPADDDTYGYGIDADPGMRKAFMYIDASEQPGDICAIDFEGEFCPDDKLMCTGWISGSNKIRNDTRCPGSVTLTVKGEDDNGNTQTIYRFCPGQIYELDNGYGNEGYVEGETPDTNTEVGTPGIDGNVGATHVVWQQFYFEFSTDQKYKRYWLEVNNNCVSSNGGDFMLDNVEVYTIVPDVEPEINTPLCISVDETGKEVTEMRLLKLRINHNKLNASRKTITRDDLGDNPSEDDLKKIGTTEEGFVFLEKYKFLETFKTELISWVSTLSDDDKLFYEIVDIDFNNITVDALADSIEVGRLKLLPTGEGSAYKTAFDAAILGKRSTWHSDDRDNENTMNSSIMYFRWSSTFENNDYQPVYSFADAVNKKHAVYREVVEKDGETVNYIVMNGNYPGLNWNTNTDYYVINTNATFTAGTNGNPGNPCAAFNLCSECCKFTEFRIDPPYRVRGLESSETTNDYVVCEGQIPTLTLNLIGHDLEGNEVDLNGINYDWWLGDPAYTEPDPDDNTKTIRPKLATLENYHKLHKEITYKDATGASKTEDVRLDKALSTFRTYYPAVTSLNGIEHAVQHAPDPALTVGMILYLKELVANGELVLHQTTVSVPAEKVFESDPYFYMVACPIHDDEFDRALNPAADEYVSYYCDEPQGVRLKLGQKAPRLQTGFVPGERGFTSYNYNFPANTNPVLSIRLAKAAQFETVKNEAVENKVTNAETGEVTYTISENVNYLWLPIRNAETEGAAGVIKKAKDDNIYLASSNDLTWDKKISKEMNTNGSLPVVGRIVQLQAVNTKNNSSANENNYNRLSVYFTKDFNVREGYNYTLSLPFQEDDNSNACDGTILINLKIVPDYEVWTGAAGNIDWNNDENWRRADGNTTISNDWYGDELYRANGAVDDEDSPLHTYTTNKDNYYSSATRKRKPNEKEPQPSSDQILRKGFAPLYCTHVLMKNDEWGNAPELYDALDYKVDPAHSEYKPADATLTDSPFPNLRDTSTPILKFDMQARRWDMWEETYGVAPDRGDSEGNRPHDLIAEMYQINSCDEIAFQPGTELRNAHLLNYNTAWVEYQLDNKRWYLLGSPLQGTISGEWYAPKKTAQQKTTYYDPVSFVSRYIKVANLKATDNPSERGWYKKSGDSYALAEEATVVSGTDYYYLYHPCTYDRYNPAIYQRSWDKAKAVLYEVGSTYATTDDSQTGNLGNNDEGIWSSGSWNVEGGGTADEYLDRLGYKPMAGNKANVAIQGIWSNTYNDAQVDYATGGFSVMVMNHLKGNDNDESNNVSIIRLPKEDTMYDYYKFDQTNADEGGTDTELIGDQGVQVIKKRALNRGRLKADKLLPNKVTVTEVGETPSDVTSSDVTIKKQEKTASIYGDKRDYTRVPTTEKPLQEMNSSFIAQDTDHPATAGFFTETIPVGASSLGYYLVENPFSCGLDMDKFFADNPKLLKKYWLLTATGQHLVQRADDEDVKEWISPDGNPIEYPDPNPEDAEPVVTDDPGETEQTVQNLTFYPHAVVAPGQGFFVEADPAYTDNDVAVVDGITTTKITFNRGMQAQSRFGMIEGEGEKYLIVVGQSQVMEQLYLDDDDDPDTPKVPQFIDVDLNGNGIYGESQVEIEVYEEVVEDGEKVIKKVKKTVDEKEKVMVPVYDEDDNPVLEDIEDTVIIYKYVPEKLKLADNSTVNKEYPLLSRQTRGTQHSTLRGLVITAKRGNDQSSALVMKRESASDDFLPSEDTETFVVGGDLVSPAVPTVYTLCGRLATTINSIQNFTCLPVGVESSSDAPCVLTFKGVEQLGDSVGFYDAVERKLTPLESGMKFTVSGQTQNRYYIVASLNEKEAAEETHLQIFTEGLTAKVIASTAEPITSVRCFDTAGRLIHAATPQTQEYSFALPKADIYIIEAQTEKDRKTKKVIAK